MEQLRERAVYDEDEDSWRIVKPSQKSETLAGEKTATQNFTEVTRVDSQTNPLASANFSRFDATRIFAKRPVGGAHRL